MRILSLSLLLPLFALAGCASTCCDSGCDPQAVVEKVARQNPDVVRLTVHCIKDGKATACASTSAAKKGQPSDQEDIQAMRTGETIVLDEGSNLDITVPIQKRDGAYHAACGVTMPAQGLTRPAAIEKATAIAKAVEAGLGDCCGDCKCK